MRFVFAIVVFVVAAIMIAVGIAQRTLFVTPDSLATSISNDDGSRYIVIDGSALTAHPGAQTLEISGDAAVFLAYGRTPDVKAWLDTQPYASIGKSQLRPQTKTSSANVASTSASTPAPGVGQGAPSQEGAGPNPTDSDLWLEQFTGSKSMTTSIMVPAGYSAIIASDGSSPAPSTAKLSWPVNNSTPWAGPLIVGGGLVLLIGLGFFLWGLWHIRKARGPRRSNPPKMPKPPRIARSKSTNRVSIVPASRGRRSAGRSRFTVIPILVASAFAFGGSVTDAWASPGTTEAPLAAPSPGTSETSLPGHNPSAPAVSVRQLENIVKKVSSVAADADASLNANALATRFAGSALDLRRANYAIRSKIPEFAAVQPIAASPLTLTLPQATDGWPRTAYTIVKNEADGNQPPTLLALTQKAPRENYLVHYAIALNRVQRFRRYRPQMWARRSLRRIRSFCCFRQTRSRRHTVTFLRRVREANLRRNSKSREIPCGRAWVSITRTNGKPKSPRTRQLTIRFRPLSSRLLLCRRLRRAPSWRLICVKSNRRSQRNPVRQLSRREQLRPFRASG